jgi:hypothetical protein
VTAPRPRATLAAGQSAIDGGPDRVEIALARLGQFGARTSSRLTVQETRRAPILKPQGPPPWPA